MMEIEFPDTIMIQADAQRVWHVIAHEFANIGDWATAIPTSVPLTHLPVPTNAPVGGRACSATVPGVKSVHEQLLYYDESQMRFGYAAVAGLPIFIHSAENHWSVQPIAATQSEVEVRGSLLLPRLVGLIMQPLLRWQLGRTGRFMLEELKYFIEEERPHPRKVRSQQRRIKEQSPR